MITKIIVSESYKPRRTGSKKYNFGNTVGNTGPQILYVKKYIYRLKNSNHLREVQQQNYTSNKNISPTKCGILDFLPLDSLGKNFLY